MLEEIKETLTDLALYVYKIFETVFVYIKPIFMWLLYIVTFVWNWFCPTYAFKMSVVFIIFLATVDILTKLYAVTKINDGVINSIQGKHYSSNRFWIGMKKKIIAYTTILILLSVSTRLHIDVISNLLNSFAYMGIVLRECYSSLENLQDAGKDVTWILNLLKRNERQIFNDSEIENEVKETKRNKK
jgi:hypothetical protein